MKSLDGSQGGGSPSCLDKADSCSRSHLPRGQAGMTTDGGNEVGLFLVLVSRKYIIAVQKAGRAGPVVRHNLLFLEVITKSVWCYPRGGGGSP